jgi:hypothetical protein
MASATAWDDRHGPENVLFGSGDNLHHGGTVSPGADLYGMASHDRGLAAPKSVSWVAFIVAGGLALFGFRFTANDEH